MPAKIPINFINIAHKEGKERREAFLDYLSITAWKCNSHWKDITKILDFVRDLDTKIDPYPADSVFMLESFHNTLASDLFTMVLLFLTNQKIQMNIILRHFIETAFYCLFADYISNFSGTLFTLPPKFRGVTRMMQGL